MDILLYDTKTGKTDKFVSDRIDNVIYNLKKLHISSNDCDIYQKVLKVLDDNMYYVDSFKHKSQSDVEFIVSYDRTELYVKSKDDVQVIMLNNIQGNCVDKFIEYHIKTFIARILKASSEINDNKDKRIAEPLYHDSNIFEEDFSSLSKIRQLCDDMSNAVKKFQENITYGYT